ncbi:sugar ABC transporter substrate-binding protein [Paenibacillus timonensis]|uniref:ABC transporter substrate-binding protein n=1 Tax=Paenibacillus timonensis TaxID=225915 RepID=A0ABW3SE15_9BACL|nr:sugar ABC transporter substrate-binding protein [Paenibacillus timonensis]MCH1641034.1 sugar ABC transporter substrate-binding protein [Paenibacillus timonensis]
MKKTRWKIVLPALMALLLLLLAGCGSNGSNNQANNADSNGAPAANGGGTKEKVKLQFWDMHTEAEQKYFEDLVKAYNESQSNVEIEYSTYNQADYTSTKLPIAFSGGNGPDIYMISPGDFMKFSNSGYLADLSPYFPEGVKEDFLPSALDAVTVDGQILALPYEMELLGLYYNEDMLKQAGVEVPKTWDELLEAARKLTTGKVAGLVLPPDKGAYFNFNFYPFLWQAGGKVLADDGKTSAFNSPETAKALDFWGTFFQEKLSPSKLQYGPWEIDNLGKKTAAMQICGTWAVSRIEEVYGDVPIKLAPLPIPDGGKAVTTAGGWKFAVNAKSKNLEEAAKFVMWAFADADTSRPLKWATETKFAYPARQSVVEAGKEIYNKGLRQVFTNEIYESAIPEPVYNPDVVEAIGDAMTQVMFGNKTGAEAAKDADAKINEAMK